MADTTINGRLLVLSIDVGGTMKVVAGIRTRDFTRDNPVSDTTNQATTGNDTSSSFNGYGTVTLSGNGAVNTEDGIATMGFKALSTIANSATPLVTCKLEDSEEAHEGDFNITSFGKSAEENGKIEFTIALQNAGSITYT